MSVPTKITFLYENLITSSMVSTNDEDSNYPIENVVNGDIASVFRSGNDSGDTEIDIDFGSATSIDTVAIAGHNFGASPTTLEIYYGAADPPTSHESMITKNYDGYTMFYFSSAQNYRYWRVTINVDTTEDYHQLGELWLGNKMQLTRNPHIPIDLIREQKKIAMKTGGGQEWSYHGYESKGYNMKFIHNVTPTQFASMELVNDDRKYSKPFFLDLAPSDISESPLFVRTTNFNFTIDGKDMRPGTWVVIEDH